MGFRLLRSSWNVSGVSSTVRVQVLNNHILTQKPYYYYYYTNPKYLIIGYMDPKSYASPLKGPNYWEHGPFGVCPSSLKLATVFLARFQVSSSLGLLGGEGGWEG